METHTQIWAPPQFDTSKSPTLASTFNVASPEGDSRCNFPRSAKWCSDGSVVLTQCEDSTFQFFESPSVIDSEQDLNLTTKPSRTFAQATPILDFLWYPAAASHDPASFCFVASVRECPVKLLDASTGRLRASYSIVDHRERQIAPHSLAFNLTAQKLYCGFEDAIEVFDSARPGEGTRISTTPSKKSKDGLKGIISSLAFCPSYSPEECFYAAGTFSSTSNNIAIFSDVTSDPVMFIGGGPQEGVTQLQFNPAKPNILYAAYRGRATGSIYSWDVRSNVHVPLEVFRVPTGDCGARTNQKIRFDIDPTGRFLSTGDQSGFVSLFQLDTTVSDHSAENPFPDDPFINIKSNNPCMSFKAHQDTVGSVAFHPFKSRILSASGSRHFTDQDLDSSESEEDDETADTRGSTRQAKHPQPVTFDSTLKYWDF